MNKITIGIADDQVLFLRAMVSLINGFGDMEVSLQATSGIQLLELLEKQAALPDILLLDLRMPGMDGMEVSKVLKKQYPKIKFVALSVLDEERFVAYMIEQGASAYLLKNSEPQEVYKTLAEVHKNGKYFSQLVIDALHKHLVQPAKKVSLNDTGIDLTRREKEILVLICQEYTMKEIGQKLSLSLRTVEGHRNNLLEKTGAKNTAGLVKFALINKLYDNDKK